MSIAQRVIDEIVKQRMVSAVDLEGRPIHNAVFAFAANTVEQLEAVIADEIFISEHGKLPNEPTP